MEAALDNAALFQSRPGRRFHRRAGGEARGGEGGRGHLWGPETFVHTNSFYLFPLSLFNLIMRNQHQLVRLSLINVQLLETSGRSQLPFHCAASPPEARCPVYVFFCLFIVLYVTQQLSLNADRKPC